MLSSTHLTIDFKRGELSDEMLLQLYQLLLRPRMIEEKMLILLRQGKISKWFSGIGQEAISVGAAAALLPDEMIFPLHRNLGIFTTRGIPLHRLFSQWQGKKSGFTKGRDRSFHFGAPEYHIVGMISHLGPQLSLAAGVALGHQMEGKPRVSLAITGEGGTSEGEFHEALNIASVWRLPVIFLIENNGYGLSTPTNEQYNCSKLIDRGLGYGMKSVQIDGNNILEVYQTIHKLAGEMRKNPHPVLLECITFRMRGHEEASGTKYVPEELVNFWASKDPIANYERYLLEEKILTGPMIANYRKEIKNDIEASLKTAFEEPEPESTPEEELKDVYVPYEPAEVAPKSNKTSEKRFIDAISEGLRMAMQKYDKLVLMGQDIAEYGGVFKITEGFIKAFGKERVRNTPLCESAVIGVGMGLGFLKYKSLIEMQFADFVSCGFNQIVNNLAKVHYRWGHGADVVVRMPTGAGVGAGPFHSQSNEAWFVHTPGLKVVYPATPHDAKGLLLASIADPNPVLFFEHKALYRSINGPVPDDYYTVELGKARLHKEGNVLSIITYGMGVHWAEKVTDQMEIDADILDLRSLLPMDYAAIETTVKKTGKVLILHEDTLMGGIGGEISSFISEHLFEYLDAPVMRVASLDTPVPFARTLEEAFLPVKRLQDQLKKLIDY